VFPQIQRWKPVVSTSWMFALKLRSPISLPRPDDGTLLPAALAGLLLLAVALQLLWTGEPDLPQERVGRILSSRQTVMIARTGIPPVILDKPLFSPARGGFGGGAGDAAQASALGGAVVAGTVTRGRARRAFLRLPDGSVRALAIGQDFDGWRLAGLTDDAARFVRAGETITMAFGASAPVVSEDAGDEEESEEE
jgi:hypothetical protein